MKKDMVIGVLGGMGTYATVHLFHQYADIFTAEKEWDRPRIIIDNRCTMPSRVRAFLYNEGVDKLVAEMTESIGNLVNIGCNRIILACNTSHLFLPQIFEKIPKAKDAVISIIDVCTEGIKNSGSKSVHLLASEGTIESKIYQNALGDYGISCTAPDKSRYEIIRLCIEAVKQNKYDDNVKAKFIELITEYDNCILGCTELPILYEKYREEIKKIKKVNVFDPLEMTVRKLKEEYDV